MKKGNLENSKRKSWSKGSQNKLKKTIWNI